MAIRSLNVTITGMNPLLQNNPQTVDRFNDYTRAMAKINAKKTRRTDEDYRDLQDIEVRAKIYWDENLGIYVPGTWVSAAIAAASFKKAKIPHAWVLPTLVGAGLFTAALFNAPWLTLTALGVVYGDIGTSPLYAMKEAFSKPEYGLTTDPATVYGVLSLVLWEESVWHWPALTIGLSIAPGPLMVPITSLLLANRLIARVTGVKLHDYGCSLKAYRRDVLKDVHQIDLCKTPQCGPGYKATCQGRVTDGERGECAVVAAAEKRHAHLRSV